MIVRRTLAGSAIALVAYAGVAAPAHAGTSYPVNRPPSTSAPQSSVAPTEVKGVKTGRGVDNENSGLPGTGGSLDPLWAGLGLLAVGGVLIKVTRDRRKHTA
jgi:hypothetical protein